MMKNKTYASAYEKMKTAMDSAIESKDRISREVFGKSSNMYRGQSGSVADAFGSVVFGDMLKELYRK